MAGKKVEKKSSGINYKDIVLTILFIASIGFLVNAYILNSKVKDLEKIRAEISVEKISNADFKKLVSEQNKYEDAKYYYEKTFEEMKERITFISWFFGILLSLAAFFVGFQFFKNERDYKDNQLEFDKGLERVKKDLKDSDFNLHIVLALNKTTTNEKISELKNMETDEKYKDNLDSIYFYLGLVIEKNDEKIKYYTKSISLNPSSGKYNNRGLAKENLKNYSEALEDYIKAIEIDPENEFAIKNKERVSKYIK